MNASVSNLRPRNSLAPRTQVEVARNTAIRPDLALIATATGKLFWLRKLSAVTITGRIPSLKRKFTNRFEFPRLWMVDPRYDNVEIYHSTEFGLQLKGILAGSEILSEKLLPEFQIVIKELFAAGRNKPAS